jgi:hypothetical protein
MNWGLKRSFGKDPLRVVKKCLWMGVKVDNVNNTSLLAYWMPHTVIWRVQRWQAKYLATGTHTPLDFIGDDHIL